ncbi:MAG TPA: PEP-CTERM sorting domain-containing protein [Verrucomicrobiae bacterium]|nr:PEP-CTERM sorting domain-containing protein [Verrucomicrobiae bacterium]
MKIRSLALASLFAVPAAMYAQSATSVIGYTPGTGFAAGFTNAATALGAPSSGGAITPFAPAFSKSQLVSIGAGGSLTLQFANPILNDPSNPYGLDFIIFGNTFFATTGGNANGSLGGNNTGSTRVEVSLDDINWFTLNPALAPTVDGIFPTDGTGNPYQPVDPSLTAGSFTGQNLAGVRSLYAGSAGGTGFDIGWAQDGDGDSINLASVDYIRIDVLSGKSEIDAVTAVPEPATAALALLGASVFFIRRKI